MLDINLTSVVWLCLVFGVLVLPAIVLFNLSRRKKAEAELLHAEQRFSVLVDSIRDYAIFMVSPDGNILSWNQGAAQIKGYTAREVIGQPISIFYTEDDILTGEPQHNLELAHQNGHFETTGWRRRKDNTLIWADVTITPLFNGTGKLTGYIKITKDLSHLRLAEEEMQQELNREKHLNEMKSRFVSFASHEFKTPLSVILSSVSLMERYTGAEEEDKRERHLSRIKANVHNLRHILDNFLSVEKLEQGLTVNQPAITDLEALANETVDDIRNNCKQGQQIEITRDGLPREFHLDSQLLRNVLVNLLSNAVKYSPAHSTIRLHILYTPGTVTFTVADNGIGIPSDEQPRLFERFFRAGNTAGIAGTGLGLSIIKKYLDLMGGRISFQSAPGVGTEFTVVLQDA